MKRENRVYEMKEFNVTNRARTREMRCPNDCNIDHLIIVEKHIFV